MLPCTSCTCEEPNVQRNKQIGLAVADMHGWTQVVKYMYGAYKNVVCDGMVENVTLAARWYLQPVQRLPSYHRRMAAHHHHVD